MNEWNKALNNPLCGSQYSAKPCRAQSCRKTDDYCLLHARLAQSTPANPADVAAAIQQNAIPVELKY